MKEWLSRCPVLVMSYFGKRGSPWTTFHVYRVYDEDMLQKRSFHDGYPRDMRNKCRNLTIHSIDERITSSCFLCQRLFVRVFGWIRSRGFPCLRRKEIQDPLPVTHLFLILILILILRHTKVWINLFLFKEKKDVMPRIKEEYNLDTEASTLSLILTINF